MVALHKDRSIDDNRMNVKKILNFSNLCKKNGCITIETYQLIDISVNIKYFSW
jgi:hypothetical protein